jgi:hypothetical protein
MPEEAPVINTVPFVSVMLIIRLLSAADNDLAEI